jgi:hypothetical protein
MEANETGIIDKTALKIMDAVRDNPGIRLSELVRTVGGKQTTIWGRVMYMATVGALRIERTPTRETRIYPAYKQDDFELLGRKTK